MFNVNNRSTLNFFDYLRHYILELNKSFSILSISETSYSCLKIHMVLFQQYHFSNINK